MEPNADDTLLWRRRQRWSAVAFLLVLVQAVVIGFFVVRLIHLYHHDKIGFELVGSFSLLFLIPLLMVTGVLTLGCLMRKDHYDKEWRKRGHIE